MSYLRSLKEPGALRGRVRTISRERNAGISLSKRRRWYAGEDDATGNDDGQPGAGASDDGGEAGESDEDDEPAPQNIEDLPPWAQKLISNTRSEAAEHRRKLREVEEAKAAEARRLAEEQGKFKELYEELKTERETEREELKTLREARTARLEILKEKNEARIGELPKDKQQTARDIITTAGTEDPDKVAAILDKIIPTLGAGTNPPPNDGGNKGDDRKQTGSTHVKLNKVSY